MSSDPRHKAMLEGVDKTMSSLPAEQLAAFERKMQEKLVAKNKVPTWVSLTGKYVIVTGANTGIGYEAVRAMATTGSPGPHIILCARSAEKGEKAAQEIRDSTKNPNVHAMVLDVSSLASVASFCKEYRAKNLPLDILINNAGIMATPYEKSADGFEMQFATNHLGHFYLTLLLSDLLIARPGAHIVNVTSAAALRASQFTVTDQVALLEEKEYEPWRQYCITKALNILFTVELQRRFDTKKLDVTCAAVHPGFVRTNLQSNIGLSHEEYAKASRQVPLDPARGAETTVYTAVTPGIPRGLYWDNSEPAPAIPSATSTENSTKLWELSERLIKKAGFDVPRANL